MDAGGFAALPHCNVHASHGTATAVAADGKTLVVGTAIGELLLIGQDTVHASCVVKAKKPIRQVEVLGDAMVVVALCDGLVTCHRSESLELLCTLNNVACKAEAFACSYDEAIPRVCLSVAMHGSLLFFRLANPVQLYRELHVRVPPSQMHWSDKLLSLATVSALRVLDADAGHTVLEHAFSARALPPSPAGSVDGLGSSGGLSSGGFGSPTIGASTAYVLPLSIPTPAGILFFWWFSLAFFGALACPPQLPPLAFFGALACLFGGASLAFVGAFACLSRSTHPEVSGSRPATAARRQLALSWSCMRMSAGCRCGAGGAPPQEAFSCRASQAGVRPPVARRSGLGLGFGLGSGSGSGSGFGFV